MLGRTAVRWIDCTKCLLDAFARGGSLQGDYRGPGLCRSCSEVQRYLLGCCWSCAVGWCRVTWQPVVHKIWQPVPLHKIWQCVAHRTWEHVDVGRQSLADHVLHHDSASHSLSKVMLAHEGYYPTLWRTGALWSYFQRCEFFCRVVHSPVKALVDWIWERDRDQFWPFQNLVIIGATKTNWSANQEDTTKQLIIILPNLQRAIFHRRWLAEELIGRRIIAWGSLLP